MTVTIAELVREVGANRWHQACVASVEDSSRKDFGRGPSTIHGSGFDMIPWEVESLIWEGEGALLEKFRLMVGAFDQMPQYAFLLQLTFHLEEFTAQERMEVWQWAKQRLQTHPSAVSNPVGYWLWCDVFESGAKPERIAIAREGFLELTKDVRLETVVESVLENSGPVPFELKAKLYERLMQDKKWHPWIFESLLRSAGDVYGHLDVVAARKVVSRLEIPERAGELEAFAAALLKPVPKEYPATLADAIRQERGAGE
jgi:hypothetical protein